MSSPEHSNRAHSELGASICTRWWNCPGSVALSRGIVDRGSSHAARGTFAHEIAEQCLRHGSDATKFAGSRIYAEDGQPIVFDAEMAANVQVYLDDCRSTGYAEGADDVEQFIEARFDLAPLKPPAPMFGTADFVAYSRKLQKLWVKDYKNGFMYVDASSPQLKYYAIGAALFLGKGYPVKTIEVTIVQPNAMAEDVRREVYGASELAAWAKELIAHAKATQEPDAPLNAGKWCKFCPVAASCPKRQDDALAVACVEFGSLVAGEATPPEVRVMTPERIGEILAKADLLEEWLKDVRAAAFAELEAGRDVPGWKLVEKRPVRRWKDEDEAAEMLATQGVDPHVVKIITPAQAEAALAESMHAFGKTKAARKAAAKEALSTLVSAASSGVTLAPEADPRPAILVGEVKFSALTDETE